MKVKYWTDFSKRKNSTKQPTGGTEVTAYLKDTTGVLNPTVVLHAYVPGGAVYAYIPDFNRYYFIDNIIYDSPDTELHLVVDPMASFKSEIGSYTGLMERTTDQIFSSPLITDPLNMPTMETTHRTASTVIGDSNPLFTDGAGTYVLTVMSQPPSQNATGGVNGIARSYALGSASMAQLALQFLDQNLLQTLISEFTNPMDAIVSCFWLPIDSSKLDTVQEMLKIGDNDMFYALYVQSRVVSRTGNISRTNIIPTGAGDNYLLRAPYATYSLYLPFIGLVPLDPELVFESSNLTYTCYVDVFTGDILYKIANYSGSKICTYGGSCATQIPVGKSGMTSALGLAGGLITTIGGAAVGLGTLAAGGGLALPALGALGAGAATMFKSAEIHTQINGSNSSALGSRAGLSIELHSWIKTPVLSITDGAAVNGLPCHKYGNAANHAGFCRFTNPSIEIAGYDAERDQINGMMGEGFYYE